MKMSHDEYVDKQRKRVGEIARGMLDGSVDYLEGARKLCSLRLQVEVDEHDPDFWAFVGVDSETDHLPIGEVRKHWSKQSLVRHEPEIQKTTEWAKEFSITQCRSLAERFGA